jgi:hypothetical protein
MAWHRAVGMPTLTLDRSAGDLPGAVFLACGFNHTLSGLGLATPRVLWVYGLTHCQLHPPQQQQQEQLLQQPPATSQQQQWWQHHNRLRSTREVVGQREKMAMRTWTCKLTLLEHTAAPVCLPATAPMGSVAR